MPRVSHNHNFFGFLVIFGFSSTSNSHLRPFFRLQVFQNKESYPFFILPSHHCPTRNGKGSNFLMQTSCTLFFGSCAKTNGS